MKSQVELQQQQQQQPSPPPLPSKSVKGKKNEKSANKRTLDEMCEDAQNFFNEKLHEQSFHVDSAQEKTLMRASKEDFAKVLDKIQNFCVKDGDHMFYTKNNEVSANRKEVRERERERERLIMKKKELCLLISIEGGELYMCTTTFLHPHAIHNFCFYSFSFLCVFCLLLT
jgi:hypothetical protein